VFFSNSELQINFCKVEGLVCKKHKTQLWVESYFFGKYTVFSYKCMDYRVLVVKFRVFEKKSLGYVLTVKKLEVVFVKSLGLHAIVAKCGVFSVKLQMRTRFS